MSIVFHNNVAKVAFLNKVTKPALKPRQNQFHKSSYKISALSRVG